jgi:hypothetical protein
LARLAQIVGAIVLVALIMTVVAPPVPQIGAGCPPGYSASRTAAPAP